MAEWLAEFRGRNRSGPYDLNLLWRNGNVYIMDNHRAAVWCWFQHISAGKTYDYVHIDEHFDTLDSQLEDWVEAIGTLHDITLDNYLDATYLPMGHPPRVPIVRYDNYLSILIAMHPDLIENAFFATKAERAHLAAARPALDSLTHVECWDVPGDLSQWIDESEHEVICNIDLDYFLYLMAAGDFRPMYSEVYIRDIFEVIRKGRADGRIVVVTISLSPENCGGWENSEKILGLVTDTLGLDFSLPPDKGE